MAQPITWRNVNAPRFGEAGALLESAGSSLQRALSGAGNLVQQGQDRLDERTSLNSEDFLSRLRSQYSDPTALREAQASGAIDALRGQYKNLDKSRTGGEAVDSLVGKLQNQFTQDAAFGEAKLAEESKPYIDQLNQDIFNKDYSKALETIGNRDLPNESQFLNQIQSAQRSDLSDTQSQEDRGRRLKNEDTANYQRNLAFNRQQSNLDRQDQELATSDKLNNFLKDTFAKERAGGFSNPDDFQKALIDGGLATGANIQDILSGSQAIQQGSLQASAEPVAVTQAREQANAQLYADNQTNSLVVALENPIDTEAAISTVMESNNNLSDLSGDDRESAYSFMQKALTEGVDVGAGGKVQLPPAMLSNLIKLGTSGGIWGKYAFNTEPEVIFNDLIKKSSGFDKSVEGLKNYVAQKNQNNLSGKGPDLYKKLLGN